MTQVSHCLKRDNFINTILIILENDNIEYTAKIIKNSQNVIKENIIFIVHLKSYKFYKAQK